MFKISYIVDDKRLPDMLRSCAGHVYSLEVVPVANAEPVSGKALPSPAKRVREIATGERNFVKELGWEKGTQFRGKDVKKRCGSLGLQESSNWYVIKNEVEAKRVRRVSTGLYEVVV